MKVALSIVVLANTVPLLVGIISYQFIYRPFASAYIPYTIIFWSAASLSLLLWGVKPMLQLGEMLRYDIERRALGRFLVVVAFLLVALNLSWLLNARDAGLDNRDFFFKLFFLFEDVIFIAFVLVAYSAFTKPSFLRLGALAALGYVMMTVFGRFGVICSFALVVVLVKSSRRLQASRMVIVVSLLFFATALSTAFVEASRMGADSGGTIWESLTDRVGEMATLSVVDRIMTQDNLDGFWGFGNLVYLYAPSVFFPEKPIINDGSVFLRETYALGAGGNGTRFPIMLHVDAFRRFGWAGVGVALLPVVLFRILVSITVFIRSRFRIPFLSIALLKYFLYIYPKSVLGLVEVALYTYGRSSIVISVLFAIYFLLCRRFPRRVETA